MTLLWVSTKKPALKSQDPETGRKFEKLVVKQTYENKLIRHAIRDRNEYKLQSGHLIYWQSEMDLEFTELFQVVTMTGHGCTAHIFLSAHLLYSFLHSLPLIYKDKTFVTSLIHCHFSKDPTNVLMECRGLLV